MPLPWPTKSKHNVVLIREQMSIHPTRAIASLYNFIIAEPLLFCDIIIELAGGVSSKHNRSLCSAFIRTRLEFASPKPLCNLQNGVVPDLAWTPPGHCVSKSVNRPLVSFV